MRQTSWYICDHSAGGSTLTCRSAKESAPSPGLTGALLGTITQDGGFFSPDSGGSSGLWLERASSIFSPSADNLKLTTPSASFSVFRSSNTQRLRVAIGAAKRLAGGRG